MNEQMSLTVLANDAEVNIFARFFGALLVELRTHDLKLDRQQREHRSYARSPIIDQIVHIR